MSSHRDACLAGGEFLKNLRPRGLVHLLGSLFNQRDASSQRDACVARGKLVYQVAPGLDHGGGPRPGSVKGPRHLREILLNPGPLYSGRVASLGSRWRARNRTWEGWPPLSLGSSLSLLFSPVYSLSVSIYPYVYMCTYVRPFPSPRVRPAPAPSPDARAARHQKTPPPSRGPRLLRSSF